MIAYVLEGVGPQQAAKDPRMARLMGAGPWQYQMHRLGTTATWLSSGPVPRGSLGEERKTPDGLIYIGPKVLPSPEQLIRPNIANRLDLHTITVAQDLGTQIKILPAYMSPRQIMDDNTLGDPTTAYGRAVRAVMEKLQADPTLTFNAVMPEMTEVCRLAVMYSYRLTRELLTDLGWLNEESLLEIWGASIRVPKAEPNKDDGS